MNMQDIRNKKPDELRKQLLELRREQFKQRMNKNSGETIKTHELRQTRNTIARIKTALNEQRRAAAE